MLRNYYHSMRFIVITVVFCVVLGGGLPGGPPSLYGQAGTTSLTWTHLSSDTGDIDVPATWSQQTSTMILDINNDGLNDFVISERTGSPSLAWFRNDGGGSFTRHVIESDILKIEVGGTSYDIDGDGDLDIVMAGDATENDVWWWENPYPSYGLSTRWVRHNVKNDGRDKHHDQIFGDFNNNGNPDLVFWNQEGASAIMLAEIPADPRTATSWAYSPIYNGGGEGLYSDDIDGDGIIDLLGGGRWFKYDVATGFTPYIIDDSQSLGRVISGDFIPGGTPEVVMVTGDGTSPLMFYECVGGDPVGNPSCWVGTDLIPGYIVDHGHSLDVADFNNDGYLDIFNAEMRLNGGNPDSGMWVFLNDGTGNFTQTDVAVGIGNHETRAGDLDGDGDIDLLGKPYNWDVPRLDIWLNELDPDPSLSLTNWQRHVVDASRPWRSLFIAGEDMNGDAQRDIITGGWVYTNPGDPADPWARQTIGSPLNNMAAVFDVDGDGELDILGSQGQGADTNPNFAWAENGGGAFTIHNNVPAGDGTFLQGVAVSSFQTGVNAVALSWHDKWDGVQTLTLPADPINDPWTWERIAPVGQGEALNAGDIDRDGDTDLLLGTQWLRNDGGTWTLLTLNPTAGEADRNRLADINGDGRLDAVVGFESLNALERVAWYEQPVNVNDTWTEHIIANIIAPMSLDVADMDGDGDLDVIAGEHNWGNPATAGLFIFENVDGVGGSWTQHTVHVGDEHHEGAQVVDIDGDGDLDILSIGWYHTNVLLYENLAIDGPSNPTAPPAPTNLTAASLADSQVDLSWSDNASDESAYHLERADDGVTWVEIAVLPANTTTYLDATTLCGGDYDYRTRAFRASDGAYSTYSNVANAVTPPCDASRVTAGLQVLYNFEDATGTTVHDVSGVGAPLDLTINNPGAVVWGANSLNVATSTTITSGVAATKVIDAVKASNAITIELWMTPANITQDGPARVFTMSADSLNRNFTVGQGLWGSNPSDLFDVRLRTTNTSNNGQPNLTSPAGTASLAQTHVIYTRDVTGAARIYVNGVQVIQGTIGGNFSSWNDTYALLLANEVTGDRPWLGTFYLAAIYDRSLSAAEVLQNFAAGPDGGTQAAFCDDVTEIPQAECEALVSLYNSTDGPNWTNTTGWMQSDTPCSWHGMTCAGGNVTELALFGNNLTGTFSDVTGLPELVSLDLSYNQFTGGMPDLSALLNLQTLHLSYNQFPGALADMGSPPNLRTLALHHNQLSGNLMHLLAMPNLDFIGISGNQLTGAIPDLSSLTNLYELNLSDNQLTGPIPDLSSVVNLEVLALNGNQLTGPIPDLSTLVNLQHLMLYDNQLVGSIPDLSAQTNWLQLMLYGNQLDGEIPASITGLVNVEPWFFTLGYNMLVSTDPTVQTFLATASPDWVNLQTIAPDGLQVTGQTATSVSLQWNAIPYTADGGYYEVGYSTTSGGPYDTVGCTTADKLTTTCDVTGLLPNTPYYFAVQTFTPAHIAQQNDLLSVFSPEVTGTTEDVVLPTAPTALSATAISGAQIDLMWIDNATDETAYHVESSDDGGLNWTEIVVLPADATTYGDTSLTCEAIRTYRVRAFRASDALYSLYSNEAANITLACPADPTNLQITGVTENQIDLVWVDNATDEDEYRLEHSPDGSAWTEIAVLPADTTTTNDSGLTCGTSHHYRVRAFRVSDALFSAYSNAVNTTTSACTTTRVTDGLLALYEFDEGSGGTVNDVSGTGSPINLTIANVGAVQWLPDVLVVNSSTTIMSGGAATKILNAVQASNAITVEAWITPANLDQDGPARIVSISGDPNNRNITLGQGLWGSNPSNLFDARLRTTSTNLNGQPSLTTPAGSAQPGLMHVVYTRGTSGIAHLYIDGVHVTATAVGGNLSNWDAAYPLILANEATGDRPWLGTLHLVAIYDQALDADEVQMNFDSGADGPTGPAAPTAPSNLTATLNGADTIGLTWFDNASDETAYRVERSSDGGLNWAEIGVTAANATSYDDTGLACGVMFDYRVRAYRAGDGMFSAYSNVSGAGTAACPPPATPTALNATPFSMTQIDLTWTDNATDESDYRLERSPDGAAWTEIAILPADTTTHSDTGLVCGTDYHYRVRTYRASDTQFSGYSNVTMTTTVACPLPPVAPTALNATPFSMTQIDLTWADNATDESDYRVERSPDGAAWTEIAILPADTTTHNDTGLVCGTDYHYRVRAYRASDTQFSGYSNVAMTTTVACPLPPAAPTALDAVAASETQIDLTWADNATDESDCRVERSPDGAAWTEIAILPANTTTHSDIGLVCGTTYHYRIRAYRASDVQFSAYSNPDSDATAACTAVRVTAGLQALYEFDEGTGTAINDVSGVGTPLDLTIGNAGAVQWLSGAIAVNTSTVITSGAPATKIINAVQASNAITVEAWMQPSNVTQDGPARIVSISVDPNNRNFTLGQGLWGWNPSDVFDARLRTTSTSNNGTPSLTSGAGTAQVALMHVVYTRDAAGTARLYIDGVQVSTGSVGGNFANWDANYAFLLANEASGDRPWLGTLHLVAVYDRALDAGEVLQNFAIAPTAAAAASAATTSALPAAAPSTTTLSEPVVTQQDTREAAPQDVQQAAPLTVPGGVSLTETEGVTAVTEGGVSDMVMLLLNSQPTADVVITVAGDGQSAATESLRFTPSDWHVPQVVTITAVDDLLVEGDHASVVSFAVSSDDAGYNGLLVPPVRVSITDNDVAVEVIPPTATPLPTEVPLPTETPLPPPTATPLPTDPPPPPTEVPTATPLPTATETPLPPPPAEPEPPVEDPPPADE